LSGQGGYGVEVKRSERISQKVGARVEGSLDPHYLGYFDYFNRGEFYEAHDVLEQLWLKDRHGPNGSFYKGLIQLAGAFVHLRKERLRPAAALFKLSASYLGKYPGAHENLSMSAVLALIQHWHGLLEKSEFSTNPLHTEASPVLQLTVSA
jgi:predicted metal-dependent hydrolase